MTVSPFHKRGRGRPARTLDNRANRARLCHYRDGADFFARNPGSREILTKAGMPRTPGDTGGGLCANRLFIVLQSLDVITTRGVAELLGRSERTARSYTTAAAIAGRALAQQDLSK